jgi:hypothetical protein
MEHCEGRVSAEELKVFCFFSSEKKIPFFRTPFKTSDTKLVGISMNMQGL